MISTDSVGPLQLIYRFSILGASVGTCRIGGTGTYLFWVEMRTESMVVEFKICGTGRRVDDI